MDWMEKAIEKQRGYIGEFLEIPFSHLVDICEQNWDNRLILDARLKDYLDSRPHHRCRMLYAIDNQGLQYSSNITETTSDDSIIGQNLTNRPYLDKVEKFDHTNIVLSEVYVDKSDHLPCITALRRIRSNNKSLGYIAADFGLKDLPLQNVNENLFPQWRQIKGDPSIRSTLFQQTRTKSAMDEKLDEVLDVIESLIIEQGIFHSKLHFSSSRATLWQYDDPYLYQVHVLDEIINPDVCLAYAKTHYPDRAVVAKSDIPKVLKIFKSLREADETIYLRSASINIMNGLIGLNFSCDGSHYLPVDEFIEKDIGFWFGATK